LKHKCVEECEMVDIGARAATPEASFSFRFFFFFSAREPAPPLPPARREREERNDEMLKGP
jgi:hypothetical protein